MAKKKKPTKRKRTRRVTSREILSEVILGNLRANLARMEEENERLRRENRW